MTDGVNELIDGTVRSLNATTEGGNGSISEIPVDAGSGARRGFDPVGDRLAYFGSFNGRPRERCLNERWFVSLGQVRETIECWRLDYSAVRPHRAPGDIPPEKLEQLTMDRAASLILSSRVDPSRGAGRSLGDWVRVATGWRRGSAWFLE